MKNVSHTRIIAALGAGFALLPATVQAQTPPAPVPPPAPVAPPATIAPPVQTAGKIDPAARALLDTLVATYKSLKSFSAECSYVSTNGQSTPSTVRSTISIQRPNLIQVTATEPKSGETRQIIGQNGTFLTIGTPQTKTYTKRNAPVDPNAILIVFSMINQGQGFRSGTGLLGTLIADPNAGKVVLPGNVQSLAIASDETIEGVSTDVVIANINFNNFTASVKFAIGKQDHLLHQVEIKGDSKNPFRGTETYSNVVANPTLDAATFAPPTGYTEAKATAAKPPAEDRMFDPRLKVGAKPLPFAGVDLAGKPLNLEQYKGKVVLVDFWATWCGPCRSEMPNVIANYKRFHAKGFEIVGVSLDRAGDRAKLVAYTKQMVMPWRQVYSGKYWESPLAVAYGVQAIPFSLLIGRDGTIVAVNPRGGALQPALEAALAK